MKKIARLVVGFSLGLVVLTGCIPPPFFDPGPEHHEDHGRGGHDGPQHDDHGDRGDHGGDFR